MDVHIGDSSSGSLRCHVVLAAFVRGITGYSGRNAFVHLTADPIMDETMCFWGAY